MDLGDGVLSPSICTQLNTIGADTVQILMNGLKEASALRRARGGHRSRWIFRSANLMLLLLEAQEGNWDELDMMVEAFQGATRDEVLHGAGHHVSGRPNARGRM